MSKRIRQIRRQGKEIPIRGKLEHTVDVFNPKISKIEVLTKGTEIEIVHWADGITTWSSIFVKALASNVEGYIRLYNMMFNPQVIKDMKTKRFYLWNKVDMEFGITIQINEPVKIVDFINPYSISIAKLDLDKTVRIGIHRIDFNRTYPLARDLD